MPGVAFADVSVGDAVPTLSKEVRRDDIVAYAEASTDVNPLHLDDDFAREKGFPGMIAHGMFTMAHLTTCLTDCIGDPTGLRSIRVLFRSAVAMGDTIVAGGTVKALDLEAHEATLEVWVRIDHATDGDEGDGRAEFAIRRSRAVVHLP